MSSSSDTLRPGVLLVAPPMLQDPNFKRSVVLLCEHSGEGSFGLMLNRPLDLQLKDVLEDIAPFEDHLSLGGPVEPNTLHFLHRFEEVPQAIRVADDIYWGGEFEAIKDLARSGQAHGESLRFFLGYAGWTTGQLGQEVEAGGWILAEADSSRVFPEEPFRLWRLILRNMGGEYAVLANFPDDPRLN